MVKQWYTAVVVMRSTAAASDHVPLYQESIVLLRASSDEEARDAVDQWVADNAISYTNSLDEQVRWVLQQVVEIKRAEDAPDHLVEIYTRHFRDYDAYRAFEPLLDGKIE